MTLEFLLYGEEYQDPCVTVFVRTTHLLCVHSRAVETLPGFCESSSSGECGGETVFESFLD